MSSSALDSIRMNWRTEEEWNTNYMVPISNYEASSKMQSAFMARSSMHVQILKNSLLSTWKLFQNAGYFPISFGQYPLSHIYLK